MLLNHPAADAFPMMDDERYGELLADIKANGQQVDIELCDGMVLDGRNRYKACLELGLQPRTTVFTGDPWSHVWSLNGTRRDIVGEQHYLIWKFCSEHSVAFQARLQQIQDEANAKRSEAAKEQPRNKDGTMGEKPVLGQNVPEPVATPTTPPVADEHPGKEAKAAAAGVGVGTVARGDALADARPDLAEQVRLGTMKPAAAHRQMKKDSVAAKIAELPDDQYRVVYADPPWSYNDKQAVKGDFGTGTGAAEGHYPSMTVAELCAMPVKERVPEDAVLFLWATSPLLPDGLKVMGAWGFKYKAAFIWDKVKHNMGHYNSVRHEFLLIGTRGSCTPDVSKLFDSVQSIERTDKHSEKPEDFRAIIDTIYPHGKRIELFARKQVAGWECWGAES